MNPIINPYQPGAGIMPYYLAGREAVVEQAEMLIRSVKSGVPKRPIMLYGLRGMGKTVLLNRFKEIAEAENYIVEKRELSEHEDFKNVITSILCRILLKIDGVENAKPLLEKAFGVLKSFKMTIPDGGPHFNLDVESIVGEGDSGDIERDLPDLMATLGEAAREYGKFICFLIDETQFIDEKSLGALIAANYRISQSNLPVIFICAGLPQIAARTAAVKSYSEQSFEFVKINSLLLPDTKKAIGGPVSRFEVSYTGDAIDELANLSGGYPYFIQEYCKFVWNEADTNPISKATVDRAKIAAIKSLDEGFFKVRLLKATDEEALLIKTMAELGDGPYKEGDILAKSGKTHNWLNQILANLTSKGILYEPKKGVFDFTVPKFWEFVRRHFEIV